MSTCDPLSFLVYSVIQFMQRVIFFPCFMLIRWVTEDWNIKELPQEKGSIRAQWINANNFVKQNFVFFFCFPILLIILKPLGLNIWSVIKSATDSSRQFWPFVQGLSRVFWHCAFIEQVTVDSDRKHKEWEEDDMKIKLFRQIWTGAVVVS